MRFFRCLSACLFGLCLLLAAQILPAAPGQITYQGRLTNPQGQPILTRVTVTFSFWDAPTGGTKLGGFSDAKSVAPNKDGIYTTTVGTDTNPIPTTVFERDRVWLNVNVNGEDLAPRQRITSSAYAVTSERTQTFTAAEAIRAGTFVMGTADGRIRKAQDPGLFNSTAFPYNTVLYPLAANKVVACYNSSAAVSIITFDTSGTATVTPVLTNTGFPCLFNLRLDNGKYVFRSGDTLAAGALSGAQLVTGATLKVSRINDVFALDTDKVVTCERDTYMPSNVTNMHVAQVKSDNTLQEIAWASPDWKIYAVCPLASGKFLAAGNSNTTGQYAIAVGALAGIAIQWGAWTPFGGSGPMLFQVDSGKAVFCYYGNGGLIYQTVTASGLTPVFGPVVTIPSSGYNTKRFSPYPYVRNKVCIENDNQLTVLTVSGNTILASDLGRTASAAVTVSSMALTDDMHVAVFRNASSSSGVYGISLLPVSVLDSAMEDWIGVAEQTVAAGQPCLVTVGGGITRMFGGLRPGRWYSLMQAGLRPTDSDMFLSRNYTAERMLIVGKALGMDKLLLTYSN